MPEMTFVIEWPDGEVEHCYSPSLVVYEHLEEGRSYSLDEFLDRCRTALRIGSDRVRKKYGYACGHAAAQLERIEARVASLQAERSSTVRVIKLVGPRPD
jgi:uncharacterized repeat protein (TIGR04042 family)